MVLAGSPGVAGWLQCGEWAGAVAGVMAIGGGVVDDAGGAYGADSGAIHSPPLGRSIGRAAEFQGKGTG